MVLAIGSYPGVLAILEYLLEALALASASCSGVSRRPELWNDEYYYYILDGDGKINNLLYDIWKNNKFNREQFGALWNT